MTNARRLPAAVATALDAAVYAVAAVVIVFPFIVLTSFALGGAWVGVKYILFVGGFLLMGLALFQLRPQRPHERAQTVDEPQPTGSDDAGEGRFEALLHRLPPLSRFDIPREDRLSTPMRLFITSLLLIGLSWVLEKVFGVAAVH